MTETLRDKIARAIRQRTDKHGFSLGLSITPNEAVEAADAAHTALAVAGPTDEMVEAGARELAKVDGHSDPGAPARVFAFDGPLKKADPPEPIWALYADDARACFTAMLAAQGEG